MVKKLPIGLMPKEFHDEHVDKNRVDEILKAMLRFTKADEPIPFKWIEELKDIYIRQDKRDMEE